MFGRGGGVGQNPPRRRDYSSANHRAASPLKKNRRKHGGSRQFEKFFGSCPVGREALVSNSQTRENGTGYFSVERSSARVLKPFVPRIPRGQQSGYAYHVINRDNGQVRSEPFKKFKSFNRFTPFKTLPETYGSIGSNSSSVARVPDRPGCGRLKVQKSLPLSEWKGSNVQGQIRQELPHVRWQYEADTISLLFASES